MKKTTETTETTRVFASDVDWASCPDGEENGATDFDCVVGSVLNEYLRRRDTMSMSRKGGYRLERGLAKVLMSLALFRQTLDDAKEADGAGTK